ncbi:MAG: SMC-Scp complex subunit ScpB [Candidatus Alcyoniella australis]|nr:SMC-Scp complex subunit ScpB [Candidatus Alcyoniella australis]
MIDRARIKSILESLVFISEEPLSSGRMARIVEGVGKKQVEELLDELTAEYRDSERGIVLQQVADGYQFRTPEANAEWVRQLVKSKPPRLTRAMIETLAIVAYNQPFTSPEIEAVRGVDCSSALKSLLDRGLIKILGRKDTPGKPLLYGTTVAFLEVFGLPDLGHLPSLKEIEELLADTGDRELITKSGVKSEELEQLTKQAKQARAELSAMAKQDPDALDYEAAQPEHEQEIAQQSDNDDDHEPDDDESDDDESDDDESDDDESDDDESDDDESDDDEHGDDDEIEEDDVSDDEDDDDEDIDDFHDDNQSDADPEDQDPQG